METGDGTVWVMGQMVPVQRPPKIVALLTTPNGVEVVLEGGQKSVVPGAILKKVDAVFMEHWAQSIFKSPVLVGKEAQ